MSTTAQNIASSDAIASVAGKLTVASGAGTAVYAVGSNEHMFAIIGLLLSAGSFLLDWYSKRRSRELRRQEIETNAALQREKNEREYELHRKRLEIEAFDRAEQRRLSQENFERIEARKIEESQARIAAMQGSPRTVFAPDSIIGAPLDMPDDGGSYK
jgi:hypothetical protein